MGSGADIAMTGEEAPFWSALDRGELVIPRCASCERWIWPVAVRCATCGSLEVGWEPTAPEGIVYSWTRTWYPFVPERSDDLPYTVLVVEIPAAGRVRLLGVLRGDEVKVGDRVAGRFAPASSKTLGLPSLTWSVVA